MKRMSRRAFLGAAAAAGVSLLGGNLMAAGKKRKGDTASNEPDVPFAVGRSSVIEGIEWLGERKGYPDKDVTGDTFPMTWADDDEIYTSSGDPLWGRKGMGLDIERFSGMPPDYTISRVNFMRAYKGRGGEGPKPCGMICVGGVLYFAFQNQLGGKPPAHGEKSQHGSDAHILRSDDHGKTWTPARKNIAEPMFPGHAFGGPAFVNFGENNEGARDGYVYAVSGDQWDNGTHLRVGRVPADRITDRAAWQWVGGLGEDGAPTWTGKLEKAVPVLSHDRHISIPDMVYLKKIKRYLLLTWHLHRDFSPRDGSSLIVYEAPEPWGPFALAHYEGMWEEKKANCYNPRVPLKWMEDDGITGWLQFSGSWASKGKYYRSNIRRFRLKMRGQPSK